MYKNVIILFATVCVIWGKDYYQLLGVSRTADEREIRRAFKKLAVTHHPDKNSDNPKAHELFVQLTTAYEVLKDGELRKKYDLYGEEGLDNSNRKHSYHSWNYYHDNFGIYDDDPEIVTLTRNDYFESVPNSDRIWLVNFYSPRCSHCHHVAPAWRKVAKELEGVIRVGAVNCEDDWHLCNQVGIQSYPTVFYYPKNAKYPFQYLGEKTYESIIRYAFDRLDVVIQVMKRSAWNLLMQGKELSDRPMLVFTCGSRYRCFTSDERLKIAATFEKMINVQVFFCEEDQCDNIVSYNTSAVFFPLRNSKSVKPILLENVDDINIMIENILEHLPEPEDLSADDFQKIKVRLTEDSQLGWLICFYVGHATELNLLLKRLPNIVSSINLGKINCGKYSKLCDTLSINRYPMWAVLKPGGAFELNHGKNRINDIAKFAEDSIKAKNVWALPAEKVLSILERANGNEAWFLDWYAPWCPPCMQFLPEVRKASLEFVASVVRFGTIDCTVHSTICRNYNIRSYPTAMLINGSNTYQFTLQKTAANIVQFIEETKNPSVILLTAMTFKQVERKKKDTVWLIDYFAPWCGPCQQLMPEWTALAKSLRVLSFVKVASVNCEKESALCRSQGVRNYPTIRMYPLGSEGLTTAAIHDGLRDSWSLIKWFVDYHTFQTKVQDLTPNTLQKELSKGKHIWVIVYFAPWCGHCRTLDPHLAIASLLLDKKIRIGRINCDLYASQCSQARIRAYPTVMLYSTKHGRTKVDNGFKIVASTAETIEREVLKFIDSGSKLKHDEL